MWAGILRKLTGWLLNVFIGGSVVGFAVMFPDLVFGMAVDVINFLSERVSDYLAEHGVEFPSLQDAVSAMPLEMRQAAQRVRMPEAISIIIAAYVVAAVAGLWRMISFVKAA